MEPNPISPPRPVFSPFRRLPALESEDIEANVVASASLQISQPSWAPTVRGRRRENVRNTTSNSFIGEADILFVLGEQPPDRSLLPRNDTREPAPPIAKPEHCSSSHNPGEATTTPVASAKRDARRPLPRVAWDAYGIAPPSQEQQEVAGSKPTEENSTLGANNRWVLLCYGNGGQGIAYPVPLEAYDPETQWRQLRNAWYTKRGHDRLRRFLYPLGFGVKKIERVTIHMQGLPLAPGGGWEMAYESIDLASKLRLLQKATLAANIRDFTSEVRHGHPVCSYDVDGVFIVRCPTWEGDDRVCCQAYGHFDSRVRIGELRMISRYAKLLQNPTSAVGNPCASLPWNLFYSEEYVQ